MTAPRQSPFALVPYEIALDHRLTASQYRVLIAILSFRNRSTDQMNPRREMIAERCGYTINSVSRITAQLVNLGFLEKVGAGGRSKAVSYRFLVPETLSNPETVADPETVSNPDTKTLSNPDTKTLADPDRGIEQTKEQTKEQTRRARANGVLRPESVSPEVWSDFLEYRRSKRAKLTPTAWKLMQPHLDALVADGWSADDVLAEVMVAGWQSFKADWIRKRMANREGGGADQQYRDLMDSCR